MPLGGQRAEQQRPDRRAAVAGDQADVARADRRSTAVSAITITSHSRATDAPRPAAEPFSPHTIGTSTSSRSQIDLLGLAAQGVSALDRAQRREPVEVAAGAERLPRSGEHDGPGRRLALQRAEQLGEVVVQPTVDSVHRRVGWSMVATRTSPSRSSLIVSTAPGPYPPPPDGARLRVTAACDSTRRSLGEWLDRPIVADLAVAVEADRLGYPARCGSARWPAGRPGDGRGGRRPAPSAIEPVPRTAGRDRALAGPDRPGRGDRRRHRPAHARRARHVERRRRPLARPRPVAARSTGLRDGDDAGAAAARRRRVDGFRLRQPPAGRRVTWPRSDHAPSPIAGAADRMVLNMVTVDAAASLAATTRTRRPGWPPRSTRRRRSAGGWRSGYVGYLGAPGYGEMFAAAGFADLVAFARTRSAPQRPGRPTPRRAARRRGRSSATESEVRGRIDAYAAAGVAEIGLVVPPLDTPSGRRTLEALAPSTIRVAECAATPGPHSEPPTLGWSRRSVVSIS